ncbi:MAG: amidohydrolase family protein [Acetobacteraceae bacterium]|nr:amidohydrolase family protein [Acetobacteraceae bacterium]MDW8397914.1 amidohydrolase family protein [Acetobacteraceae bacterium]
MTGPTAGRRSLLAAAAAAPFLAAQARAQAQPPAPAPDPARPILIRGATVLTMDSAIPDLPRGDILVRNGAIEAVAASIPPPEAAVVIEGANRIALPGFVNGHIHLAQVLQRGLSSNHSFGEYFQTIVLRYSNRMTVEDVAAADLVGALEALHHGVTTIVDWSRETMSPAHCEAAVEALTDSGIRARLLYTVPPSTEAAVLNRHVEHAREVHARLGEGRVRLGTCMLSVEQLPVEVGLAHMRRVRPLGLFTSIHTGGLIYPMRRPRAIELLSREGLLDSNLQIVHANAHDEDEYALAARAGVMLSATPEVELRMGHGQPAAFKGQDAGMRTSLGTDIPTMVGGSMLAQARIMLTAELHRNNTRELSAGRPAPAYAVTPRRLLELLTIEGAKGVGLDRVTGSLTPGKRADIILVATDAPGTLPALDPYGTVLFHAEAADIRTVLCDGRIVKQDGRLTHPGQAAAYGRAAERAAAMVERARAG